MPRQSKTRPLLNSYSSRKSQRVARTRKAKIKIAKPSRIPRTNPNRIPKTANSKSKRARKAIRISRMNSNRISHLRSKKVPSRIVSRTLPAKRLMKNLKNSNL